jgi:hypothetical protein
VQINRLTADDEDEDVDIDELDEDEDEDEDEDAEDFYFPVSSFPEVVEPQENVVVGGFGDEMDSIHEISSDDDVDDENGVEFASPFHSDSTDMDESGGAHVDHIDRSAFGSPVNSNRNTNTRQRQQSFYSVMTPNYGQSADDDGPIYLNDDESSTGAVSWEDHHSNVSE